MNATQQAAKADKQQHVAENWQDKALAAKWQKVSNKIEQARTQIDLINW